MLKISKLSFFLGNKQLYDDCSLEINDGEKIALIGPNGAGKSTLMKLITGELKPDSGTITLDKDVTLGFFNQNLLSYNTNASIKSVAMGAFDNILKLEEEVDEIGKKLEVDYSEDLYNRMMKIYQEIERLDGYKIESRTEVALELMGFKTSDLDRPLSDFSGGWRMRVMLAKILLEKPSLLMLDEPTNHLDIESIGWLEKYLIDYSGAFIIISHDRYFLDKVTKKTIELDNKKLVVYSGNYTYYEQEKERRVEENRKLFNTQQKKIDQLQDWIDKNKSKASKASQAKNMEKRIEKMDKVELIKIKKPKINFSFESKCQSGKIVVNLTNIEKSYGDNKIFNKSNGLICRNDKIAFIGANGKGKSTLLKLIYYHNQSDPNYEKLDSGSIEYGPNVIASYYAQHQLESLNLNNIIINELIEVNPSKKEDEIRQICGMFLFSKDDVYKKIDVLSGGEKARVALIKMLLTGANFLLLDEPTNHLDITTIDLLGQAINQYNGTCIVVSHDRHFVSTIATKIWYINDHVLKEYPGTYSEFLQSGRNL